MASLGRLDFAAWVACFVVLYAVIPLISKGLCTREKKKDIYSSNFLVGRKGLLPSTMLHSI